MRLAFDALRVGGAAPIVLNAVNECSVTAFLAGQIGFLEIAQVNESALNALSFDAPVNLDDVLAIDAATRVWAGKHKVLV